MILLLFYYKKHHCQHDCHEFRDNDGDPDAVDPPDQRQDQDRRHLKYECPQKRDQRGGQTVIEGCKKTGTEDRIAHKEK